MGTRTLRTIAAGAILTVLPAITLAQDAYVQRATQASFTAGQGGLMQTPVRPTQTFYSFTGDVDARIRAQQQWQRAAGPRFRVGQAEITLPSAR